MSGSSCTRSPHVDSKVPVDDFDASVAGKLGNAVARTTEACGWSCDQWERQGLIGALWGPMPVGCVMVAGFARNMHMAPCT